MALFLKTGDNTFRCSWGKSLLFFSLSTFLLRESGVPTSLFPGKFGFVNWPEMSFLADLMIVVIVSQVAQHNYRFPACPDVVPGPRVRARLVACAPPVLAHRGKKRGSTLGGNGGLHNVGHFPVTYRRRPNRNGQKWSKRNGAGNRARKK